MIINHFEFHAENLTRCLNESGQPPESQDSVERMERLGQCRSYGEVRTV